MNFGRVKLPSLPKISKQAKYGVLIAGGIVTALAAIWGCILANQFTSGVLCFDWFVSIVIATVWVGCQLLSLSDIVSGASKSMKAPLIVLTVMGVIIENAFIWSGYAFSALSGGICVGAILTVWTLSISALVVTGMIADS